MFPLPYMPVSDLRCIERWRPVDAEILGAPGLRSPARLRAVLAQLDPAGSPRYQPHDGATWCNVFVWDGTRALGSEVPHWLPREECLACEGRLPSPDSRWGETQANALIRWLELYGPAAKWRAVDASLAGAEADRGHPVVVGYLAPQDASGHRGTGHVALMLPPRGSQLRLAQAGAQCLWDAPLGAAFGSLPVRFWAHD